MLIGLSMWSEGTIVEWRDDRGFGFAENTLTHERIFVHIKEFKRRGQPRPVVGDQVEFYIQHDERGRARAALISYCASSLPSARSIDPSELAVPALFAVAFGGLLTAAVYLGHVPWWVTCPYIVLGPVSGFLYLLDKEAAQQGSWRVSERNLLLVDLVGGWIGGLFAQVILRHKTRKLSFLLPFWIIVSGHYFLCFLAAWGVPVLP